jgi:hypothetical protein
LKPKCNPPPVSSSDEFKDPFSEDTGGGLLEIDGGKNIQGTKAAKRREEKREFRRTEAGVSVRVEDMER